MKTRTDGASTFDAGTFLSDLSRVVDTAGLIIEGPELQTFAEDALRGRGGIGEAPATPLAIVRPRDALTVANVLRLATKAGVPVVAYGSGTGLMGGARSTRPGIVLDTVRLHSIDVQAEDRTVWAGAGAVLKDVDAVLQQHGMCLGHDPWTFPVATVGGTLSTNSLGYKGGRYGGMADQAVALEVALADGTLFRTRAVRRHSAGPNLTRLFTGAEGTLGVITAACLLGHPVPEAVELRAFNFATFEEGFGAIEGIAALGLRPSLLDYGEEHASPWPELAEREEEPPLLYVGFEGFEEEVAASWVRAKRIVDAHGAMALPQAQAYDFWERRHVVAERFARGRPRQPRMGREGVAFDYIHVALPPSQVLGFRADCHESAAREGVGLVECGLWTAPDFFSAVFVLPDAQGGHALLTEVLDGLLRRVQDLGGSMEYVHGAGLRLAHLMPREHGEGFDVLRRIKAALDPDGVLNPGKLGF
ncbi:MAG TPA: FAD-binding oxidoreductase [Dehalococcoidia bacterium]|nr:FAD-binding oxidoreductase [Dehalococcoidia bacterium]